MADEIPQHRGEPLGIDPFCPCPRCQRVSQRMREKHGAETERLLREDQFKRGQISAEVPASSASFGNKPLPDYPA